MSVKGLDDFLAVLDILKNPQKYDAKIAELKQQVEAYRVVIESVVKLSEVNDYTKNIAKREAESKELLDKTKTLVEEQMKTARVEADALRDSAKAVLAKTEEKFGVVVQRENALVVAEKEVAQKVRDLDNKALSLDKKEAELVALATELADKKAKLLAAMG